MQKPQRKEYQTLGFDSCGIIYIGVDVQSRLAQGSDKLNDLAAAAGDMAKNADLRQHDDAQHPGQHWSCYRPKAANLAMHLREFLTPSTTQADLDAILTRPGVYYFPYLRF